MTTLKNKPTDHCKHSFVTLGEVMSQVGTLWLFTLLLVSSGCATRYQEPPTSANQVAWLEADSPVWVVSIDGKKVSRFGIIGEKRFKLLPGTHSIEVQYSNSETYRRLTRDNRRYNTTIHTSSKHNQYVNFVAEAGHVYYVQDGKEWDIWRPYISESRTPVFMDVKAP